MFVWPDGDFLTLLFYTFICKKYCREYFEKGGKADWYRNVLYPYLQWEGKGKVKGKFPFELLLATLPAVSIALQSRGVFLIMNTVNDQYHKCCGQQKTVK